MTTNSYFHFKANDTIVVNQGDSPNAHGFVYVSSSFFLFERLDIPPVAFATCGCVRNAFCTIAYMDRLFPQARLCVCRILE